MPPTLTVVGTGTVRATPDVAYLTLGVQMRAPTASAAQAQANLAMREILKGLGEAGVDQADLATVVHGVFPEGRPYTEEAPPAFQAWQRLRVVVRDVTRAGMLLDLAVARGANANSGVAFGFTDLEARRRPALAEAVRHARENAESIAAAAGLRLGEVLAIWAELAGLPTRGSSVPMVVEVGVPASVEPGEQSITAAVRITYRLTA